MTVFVDQFNGFIVELKVRKLSQRYHCLQVFVPGC